MYSLAAKMASNSSNSVEGLPARFDNIAARERYHNVIVAKNIWEVQGFLYDDGLDNYVLELVIYKRLADLGWLRFGRQPTPANINWVREFHAHNTVGENTVVHIRGQLVPADAAIINSILDLSNDEESISNLIEVLEEEDYETIKNQLCSQGTEWNRGRKDLGTINRRNLRPEAKLWNIFIKSNLMPISYTSNGERVGRNDYMKKMDLIDALPIKMAMPPTVGEEEEAEPANPSVPVADQPSPTATAQATSVPSLATTIEAQANFAATPASPPTAAKHQPPLA
ncbi:hypothetical protein V6N12_012640 [Hibiscus sabdariffa]|uniref:Putative plant transposon protein domain-containing protein n=1 Tax=Hibiscus sabdariffa TaxID=183260 RepID=A0ABR2DD48_9ROSI